MPSKDEGEQEPVVVRDRRRIDPDTGQLRAPNADEVAGQVVDQVPESISGTLDEELAKVAQAEAAGTETVEGAESGLQRQVDELTVDLKRVTAEYANYRKRVERDRESVAENAKAAVAGELLTVLDDVERADAHGDLTGAFKAVTDKLITSLTSAGLEPFGEKGEEFDPAVHEAVQHTTSADVSGPTVTTVLRRGYRFGERVVRPAMVAVTDYEAGASDQSGEESAEQG